MKSYAIMHQDLHVATIRGDGSCTIYQQKFMPYNLYPEDDRNADLDVRINNLSNFCYWCATRLLLIASRIARCFDVEQVLYESMDYQGQSPSLS